MPRKTDGIPFELHPRPTKDEDGKALLYARPVGGRKLSIAFLDDYCAKYKRMQPGELTTLFNKFIEAASVYLAEGYRIETPIGSFAPKLKLIGEHTDPSKVVSTDVVFDGLDFSVSKKFCDEVRGQHHGCRKAPIYITKGDIHDEAAMDAALKRCLAKGDTTINTFSAVAHLAYSTAKNYLNSLCEGDDALLAKRMIGRSWVYYYRKR